jgi:plastocyanin
MSTTTASHRVTFGTLTNFAIGALLALSLDMFLWNAQAKFNVTWLWIVTIASLVGAGIMATRQRWSPALIAALFTFIVVAQLLPSGGGNFTYDHLTHPQTELSLFTVAFLFLVLNAVILGSSYTIVWQQAHHEAQHAPSWLKPALAVLAGIVVGAMFVAAIARPSAVQATDNGPAIVHTELATFAPNIVALHKGDTLTISADSAVQHNLMNGTWDAGNHPMPGVEPGAPIVHNLAINNNSVKIGPFTTPGTYHIYCTIHPGMVLTIVVIA